MTDGSQAGDWRQPTISEFCSAGESLGTCPPGNASDSLVNTNFSNPTVGNAAGDGQWAVDDAFVGVLSTYYWSSTSYVPDPTNAWNVNLGDGNVFVFDDFNRY